MTFTHLIKPRCLLSASSPHIGQDASPSLRQANLPRKTLQLWESGELDDEVIYLGTITKHHFPKRLSTGNAAKVLRQP